MRELVGECPDVFSAYDGWVAVGPLEQIGVTDCVKQRYERGTMFAEVWLEPVKNWRGDQPDTEIKRQLDRAKEALTEAMQAKEYARMC